ncbi:hypothetical protein [Neotabrizicola sp. VNH66]|uniref:hypothetical protein n=1 Tax=Neotabrizicola sp. VNH66 TaxID=3400918 RepID=UPI003C09DF1F
MRLTLTVPALLMALALSGCGADLLTAHPGNVPQIPAVCAEQSALATQGRSDGREIRIICP